MDYEDYSTECPVCNIRVANSNDVCTRCGAEIKSDLPETRVREEPNGLGSSLYQTFTSLPTYFL
jgi:predicted amidophosphoribosyltransferase